jgi:hypothetical protein
MACEEGRTEAVGILLEAAADVNALDAAGRTLTKLEHYLTSPTNPH